MDDIVKHKRSELQMDVANVNYPFTSLCSSPNNVLLGKETMSYFCVHLGDMADTL